MIGGVYVYGQHIAEFGEGGAILLSYLYQHSVDMRNYRHMEVEMGSLDFDDEEHGRPRLQEYEQMKLGWFPFSEAKIRQDIGMSEERQRNCLKLLEQAGKIKIQRRGLPARRWVYINRE